MTLPSLFAGKMHALLCRKEKIWWFLFKPFYGLFANKVLNVIKKESEYNEKI